jgi:hypothetical protein
MEVNDSARVRAKRVITATVRINMIMEPAFSVSGGECTLGSNDEHLWNLSLTAIGRKIAVPKPRTI